MTLKRENCAEEEEKATIERHEATICWPCRDQSSPAGTPWAKKPYELSLNGLHCEIVDLYHWMRPTALENALRLRVLERVRCVVNNLWPEARVECFGSLRTGLFLPSSDIDVLIGCVGQSAKSSKGQPPLWTLAEAIRRARIADHIQVLNKAFVPIVKLVDHDTGIRVDISFNTTQGIQAANLVQVYLSRYPVLAPLVFLLKQFLAQRQLHQVFTGGLSSYGLILIIVNFLQLYPYGDLASRTISDINVGFLLLGFLQLYGQELNYMKTGLRIRGGGAYLPKEVLQAQMTQGHRPSMLCIEDPLRFDNDVGRGSHNILTVRKAFEEALHTLSIVFRYGYSPAGIGNWLQPNGDDGNFVWQKTSTPRMTDSMLSQIVTISPRLLQYRNWLRGFVLRDSVPSSPLPLANGDQMMANLHGKKSFTFENDRTDQNENNNNNNNNNNNWTVRWKLPELQMPSPLSNSTNGDATVQGDTTNTANGDTPSTAVSRSVMTNGS